MVVDGALACFSTWCPHGIGIAKLVDVEGRRWPVEDGFETGKNEFGFDHNEARSWHDRHRHVSLSMMALAMMAAIRRQAHRPVHQKTSENRETTVALIRWSVQEIRRLATRLPARRAAPAHLIAWSCWRRAHQTRAKRAHLRKSQL